MADIARHAQVPAGEPLGTARDALDRGDWTTARSLLVGMLGSPTACGADPSTHAETLVLAARASEWAGEYGAAITLYERAFAAYRKLGEVRVPALIAGRELSFLHLAVYGHYAVAAGWLERARRLAASAGDCVEVGWVELALALSTDDPDIKAGHARAAAAIADRHGDTDLGFCALCYEGTARVLRGDLTAGLRCLDEAAAAAAAGEVKDYAAAGEIFCHVLSCCELALDVRRAEQWIATATLFADRSHAPWVSALCRTNYGGILTAAGRWDDAEKELTTAVGLYDASYSALRSAALVRLADLRVLQGRYNEADRLLAGLEFDSYAVRPLARLLLARGDFDGARRVLRRRLQPPDHPFDAPGLSLLTEAELAARDLDAARAVCRRLKEVADRTDASQVRAFAAYAAGLTCAQAGDSSAAQVLFESALSAFAAAGLAIEEARARMAVSRLSAALAPTVAVAEAEAALAIFDRLTATAEAAAAARHLRTLGVIARRGDRVEDVLTRREAEVLRLMSEGLGNNQIAERLVISKRTVEHHVGNVFAKLGVSSRAEAIIHFLRYGAG